MVFFTGKDAREFKKLKNSFLRYQEVYKKLNKGSLKGSADFATFYLSQTYVMRYSDNRKFFTHADR